MKHQPQYYKLPTVRRQFLVTLAALVVYVVGIASSDIFLPELSELAKKKFTQVGLAVIFISGLLAGLGFVWASRARHNERLANEEVKSRSLAIKLLESQAHANIDVQSSLAEAKERVKIANENLEDVSKMPAFFEFFGATSLILLEIGTLLCYVGAT
jgi:hypothetical protein